MRDAFKKVLCGEKFHFEKCGVYIIIFVINVINEAEQMAVKRMV